MKESQESKGISLTSLYENAHKKLFFKRERFCQ